MKYFKIIWCVLQALSGVLAIVGWVFNDHATLSASLQLPALLIGTGYGLYFAVLLMAAGGFLFESTVRLYEARKLRERIRSQRLRKARS